MLTSLLFIISRMVCVDSQWPEDGIISSKTCRLVKYTLTHTVDLNECVSAQIYNIFVVARRSLNNNNTNISLR
jgi:hypothetical protein